jgi:hypothetical protein
MRPAFFNSNKQHGTATVTCLPKASYMYCIICFPRVMWCHCDIPHCAKAKPYGLAIWRMHALTIQACWPHVRAPQAAHPYPAPESATAQPWSGTAGAQRCEIQTQQKASAVSVGDLLFAPRLTCPPNSHPDTPFFSYPHPLPQCHPTHTLPLITRLTDASMLPPSPVVARRSTPPFYGTPSFVLDLSPAPAPTHPPPPPPPPLHRHPTQMHPHNATPHTPCQ